ncbi:MBL fold metallo-hydrolase [Halosimplex aquaticum]|uniref:MBL fold metallo-hydrolase n=1 Tax=Halosimplex aquaticum TaxID=3026162 RepID=A0ABD5YA17_9EURY|nr:MBL fold metallo-hydrolase [Halosimplex aquaticum]
MPTRLAEGVWMLDLGLVPPLSTNGYLVDDGTVTLIDPGLFWNRPSLGAELSEIGYEVADVDRVFLTHYDLDHTGGLRALDGEFDGPVYIGADDLALVRREQHPKLIHHKGLFHRAARRLFPLPAHMDLRGVEDGEEIGRFTAFHTPGHNPGHTVFVHDSGVAFLGDLVWESDGRLTPPIWFDSYDMREIGESIRGLAERVPSFEVAAVAHGTPLIRDGRTKLLECAARL